MTSTVTKPTLQNAILQHLVDAEGWKCVSADGSIFARRERIGKDGVVLDWFSESGGEDRGFAFSSPALAKAANGVTVIPSFERVFRDLNLELKKSDKDFQTISDNLGLVKSYLGDEFLLMGRLRSKRDQIRKRSNQWVHTTLFDRLSAKFFPNEFVSQMKHADIVHQRAARNELPLFSAAIKSLFRSST